MKAFCWGIIILGIIYALGADKIRAAMDSHTQWRLNFAVQQATDAKRAFASANADNQNALDTYDAESAEERKETLIDSGLLSDQTAMCLVDPGALDGQPTAHTPVELDAIARQARRQAGAVTLAMR